MQLRSLRPTPGTVIALLALFFALGGSAFAVSEAAKPNYVVKCTPGAVLAVAVVTGDAKGVANIPDSFTANGALFARRFTCQGSAPQVRRLDRGTYDIRFPGSPVTSVIATGLGDAGVGVSTRQADGSFRITVQGDRTNEGTITRRDLGFIVVGL